MLSIIMPTYNDERYVERAINSVISQSFQNWELIIVNDGSTDSTGEILKKYASEKIKVITKSHSGVSASRNIGIKFAKGQYIAFLDSDDYLSALMYRRMMDAVEDNDVSVCGYTVQSDISYEILEIEKENKYIDFDVSHIYPLEKRYASGNVIDGIKNLLKTDTFYYIWNKIYRKDIITNNNITFDENVICWGEDEIFNCQYFKYVNKMNCIAQCDIFFSTEKEDALSYKFDDIRFLTEKKIRKELIELYQIKSKKNSADGRELAEIFFCKLILLIENLQTADFQQDIQVILMHLETIFSDIEIKNVFTHLDLTYQFIYYLKNLFYKPMLYDVFEEENKIFNNWLYDLIFMWDNFNYDERIEAIKGGIKSV